MTEIIEQNGENRLASLGLDLGVFAVKAVLVDGPRQVTASVPTAGQPRKAACRCIEKLLADYRNPEIRCGLVGHNARLLSGELGVAPLLDIEALQKGLAGVGIKEGAVLSLGHENMYYLELDEKGKVRHFNRNAQCAAGSGSFWYQQATRMGYNDREMAAIALGAESAVPISGRCAVFAKSDMTHAINDGATQAAVAAGMARALVDTILTGVAQNRICGPGTLIILGGVAENEAILKELQAYADREGIKIIRPALHRFLGALGAAAGSAPVSVDTLRQLPEQEGGCYRPVNPLPPLDPARVLYLDNNETLSRSSAPGTVYLGIDCGSVSTKCALLDGEGRYIGGVYLPTAGRPALQVLALMKEVEKRFGQLLEGAPLVACTTGSGRFLSQNILDAEFAVDEITCQAEGVKKSFPEEEDLAIFEIGGEDSKFLQLRSGVLCDYNMNPVCAAGTGTFLENLAELLGVKMIGEFSEKAFAAAYAIDLGDTCTLLSQSALVSAAARGLPLETQLASLACASARNYLGKTVEKRTLEGRLIFTGATARNSALAAALAAECDRQITVPPQPELTGALGAALMAKNLEGRRDRRKGTFRGLRQLNSYSVSQRPCRAPCEHRLHCTLQVLTFSDGQNFIYGDRCGRYSGRRKRAETIALPDYARRREKIFFQAAGNSLKEGPSVGIARCGLFFELYPFWAAFFRALGASVLLSEPSRPSTLDRGKRALDTEMCLPMEINVGHYGELAREKELDYIFLPEVVDLPPLPWAPRWPRAFTCSLLQTMEGTMVSSLSLDRSRLLTCQLNYREGPRRITDQLRPAAQRLLGAAFTETYLRRAVAAGYKALETFQELMEKESEKILEELSGEKSKVAALFLSRPYTIYDDFISKGSLRHAREIGLPALPHEILLYYLQGWSSGRIVSPTLDPFREEFKQYLEEVLRKMDHIYPAQLQRMLSSAIFAVFLNDKSRQTGLPQLHLVLHDPFKCGPNSMFRHYLGNLAPYLRLTLDQHTAPAGLITRLEAFKNTYNNERAKRPKVHPLSAGTVSVASRSWKKLLIPEMSRHAHAFAAMFRRFGVDAALLPRSADPDLTLARRCGNGEECLPFLQNLQDYLEYLRDNPAARGENIAFFQGLAAGPCRYGLYAPTQALAINGAGYDYAEVCAVGLGDALLRFGLGFALPLFSGMTAMDLLYKMLHATRPYETETGRAEQLFEHYSGRLLELLERSRFNLFQLPSGSYMRPFEALLDEAASSFAALPRRSESRPLILLGGEFYVRWDSRCNENIIEEIEQAGGKVCLAPATEVGNYNAYMNYWEARNRYRSHRTILNYALQKGFAILTGLAHRDDHRLEKAAAGALEGLKEPPPEEIKREARRYITDHYGGEPPMTIGRAAALARRGAAAGAIFVAPFNCMPGSYVEAQQGLMQKELGIPVITVYYDGKKSANRKEQIAALVYQAAQRLPRR